MPTAIHPSHDARAHERAPTPAQIHRDMVDLTHVVGELAQSLKPLATLAEHAPVLVEMAKVWQAGKSGGRAVGRFSLWLGAIARWLTTVAGAAAVLWMAAHAQWTHILRVPQP